MQNQNLKRAVAQSTICQPPMTMQRQSKQCKNKHQTREKPSFSKYDMPASRICFKESCSTQCPDESHKWQKRASPQMQDDLRRLSRDPSHKDTAFSATKPNMTRTCAALTLVCKAACFLRSPRPIRFKVKMCGGGLMPWCLHHTRNS